MARQKGAPKTGGRCKGAPNKITNDLKQMILGALDDVGGQKYLARQAEENPVAFMGLIGKVLPTTLNATVEPKGNRKFIIERAKRDRDNNQAD
jgi:hypothetical protein